MVGCCCGCGYDWDCFCVGFCYFGYVVGFFFDFFWVGGCGFCLGLCVLVVGVFGYFVDWYYGCGDYFGYCFVGFGLVGCFGDDVGGCGVDGVCWIGVFCFVCCVG